MDELSFQTINDFSKQIRRAIDALSPEKTTLWRMLNPNNINHAKKYHCGKLPGVLLDDYLIDSKTIYPSTFANENSLATTVQNAIIENIPTIFEWLTTSPHILELQAPITYTLTTGKMIRTTGIALQDTLAGIDFVASTRANIILVTDTTTPLGFKLWTARPSMTAPSVIDKFSTRTRMSTIHQSSICQQSASARAYAIGRITKNTQFHNATYIPSLDAISVKSVFGLSNRGVDQDVAYIRPDGIFITIIRHGILANHIVNLTAPKRALDIVRNKQHLDNWLTRSPVAQKLLPRSLNIARLVNNCADEIRVEQKLKSISRETAIVPQSNTSIIDSLKTDL